jgi:hypothetical protein
MKAGAVATEASLAVLLIVTWLLVGPGTDVSDDPGGVFLALALACLFSGWHLLGGWGIGVGCSIQLLRFTALVVLAVLFFSAYNPHMDNWCNDSLSESCIADAQRAFRWTYFTACGGTIVSSLAIFIYAARRTADDG